MCEIGRLLAVLFLTVLVAPPAGASEDGAGPYHAPAWPDDVELEALGTRIGSISVRKLPIFDPAEPGENKALFRLADRVHIDTRESVIETQLLFRAGDLYSRRQLDETTRILRQLRFIREPEIRIVGYHDGLVDLEITTHEVWTTNPGISFGRSGGENSLSIQFEELNLFGYGKHVGFDYANDVDRTSYTVRWLDPGIWGSRWQSELAFRDSNDGAGRSIAVERPFFSLETRWSAAFKAAREDSIADVYRLGETVGSYRQDKEIAEIRYGRSGGLRNGWTRRVMAGLRHEQALFGVEPGIEAPAALPADRSFDYPFLRYEVVQDHFATGRNRDQIARTEDLHYGIRYAVELGLADTALGSGQSAALIRAEASRGIRLDDGKSLFLHSTLAGRIEGSSLADGLLTGGVRFFRETGPRSKFFAALNADLGYDLDADHELSLGGDSGLRGYPLRYQNGSGRALLTVEQRYYTNRSLWKLADIGGAVFFDMGRSWGESAFGSTENQGLLKDVGVGLRIATSRSSRGNVLHVDVAFPLDGPKSISRAQLLIQTKTSF